MYLALECGHPSFRTEFAVSEPTQVAPRIDFLFAYTTITFYSHSFQSVLLRKSFHIGTPTTPPKWFGLFPFRSSLTKGISYVFFSSAYLDISVLQVTEPTKVGTTS